MTFLISIFEGRKRCDSRLSLGTPTAGNFNAGTMKADTYQSSGGAKANFIGGLTYQPHLSSDVLYQSVQSGFHNVGNYEWE